MEPQAQEEKQAKKQFARLIQRLSSTDPKERAVAEKELWQMGSAAPARLRAYLEGTRRERMLWPRLFLILGSLGLAVTLIAIPDDFIIVPFFILFDALLIFTVRWQEQRNTVAKALARFDDVRNIRLLIEALDFTDGPTRLAVSKALTRSLSCFTSRDTAHIGQQQKERLCKLLAGATTEQALAILKVLEQVGDKTALPYVQRLTASPDPLLRKAAEECLVYLQHCAEQESIRQTLLRPSSVTEVTPETLLRPTIESCEVDPQQLLRPQITQNSDA